MKKTHVGPERYVSFVPVFVAATLSVVYFFHINYYKKTLVIIKKKDEKLKKNSLRARKDSRGVVQVLFRHGCPPCSVFFY